MANRPKRSISLPEDVDAAIERAAAEAGTTYSGWLADVAAHRLKLDAGWHGIEQWESDHGKLTAAELAEGRRVARASLAAAAIVAVGRVSRSADAGTEDHPDEP